MIFNLPFTYSWLLKRNISRIGIKTILELGCGKGDFADLLDKDKYKITGVDIFEPYLKIAREKSKYTNLLKKDLTKKLDFKDKSFDAVVCLQVIEHMKFKEGQFLLDQIEKIAKKLIIISTPNGKCVQEEYDENKYQRHLSVWGIKDFEKRGYKVSGTGLKQVYGTHSHAGDEISPGEMPLYLISFLMNPIAYVNPNIAAQLIAIKHTK